MSTVETTKVLDKIRERGYWSIVIRPATFDDSRIPYADLFSIIERKSVRYRGWDYPCVYQGRQQRGSDWIGIEYEGDLSIEAWRFHTSGLFIHHFAMFGEWRDESKHFWRPEPNETWEPYQFIYYMNTIYSFVEIFEFASRLALSPAGGPQMRVDITINNIQGRKLVSENPGQQIRFSDNYRVEIPEWTYGRDLSQNELIAMPRELAADATKDFLARFGANVSFDTLRELQGKLGR